MKSALLSLTIGSLLLSGCWLFRPNNPPTPCVAEIDPDFLSYFAFPEGSWWVYREVNSGRKDSFWVSQFAILEDVPVEGTRDCIDQLGFQVTNGDSIRYFAASPDDYAHSLEGHSLLYSLKEIFYLPGATTFSFQIFYPPSKDSSIFLSSGFELLPLQESYSINGQTFGPVIWSRQHPPFRYYTPVVETIFSQGVGMISWTTISGEQWELEKYHLE